jgi:nitrogen fixation/metabolism regulation signal transduction histidine kinase
MRRLHTRLVVAFLVVALLPAVPLTWVVWRLFEGTFSESFERDVTGALEAALTESRRHLRAERGSFTERLETEWRPGIARGELPAVENGVAWIVGEPIPAPDDVFAPETVEALRVWGRGRRADPGAAPTAPEIVGDALAAAVARPGPEGPELVGIARALAPGQIARADRIRETAALFRLYREERGQRLRSYLAPFALAYAGLLALAAVVGLRLARRIAGPVEALAAGARRVAGGDLAVRVDARATGEVGDLVDEFNRMIEEIAAQRAEVARLERVAAWRDLARSLAHEIKNPLTPIQLAVQQLADRVPRDGESGELLDECVGIVNEEVESLRRLVREFSEFARLPRPKPEPGDLSELLDEVARLYGDERVTRDGSGSLPARFDEAELKRALLNLVDNGLAACAAAGRTERVVLGGRISAGETVLTVTDEGCGIPDANLARVFEPNFSTKSEGMGLGLAIVEGIVRGHGGTIDVASRPDEGTTFTIRLPGLPTPAVKGESAR